MCVCVCVYVHIYIYTYVFFLVVLRPDSESWPPLRGFAITLIGRITLGRTHLYEWSAPARHRDLYLTTHNTHKSQTSIPHAGFEPTIPANPLLRWRGHWARPICTHKQQRFIYVHKLMYLYALALEAATPTVLKAWLRACLKSRILTIIFATYNTSATFRNAYTHMSYFNVQLCSWTSPSTAQ